MRAYLKGLGAEISEENSPKGIEDDLHKIIGVCDACFRDGQETEVESVLNDIVSMMVFVSTTFLHFHCIFKFLTNYLYSYL